MNLYFILAIVAVGVFIAAALVKFPRIEPSFESAEDVIKDKQHPERKKLLAKGALWASLLILLLVAALGYGLVRLFVSQVDRMAPPTTSPQSLPTYTPIPTYFNPSEI